MPISFISNDNADGKPDQELLELPAAQAILAQIELLLDYADGAEMNTLRYILKCAQIEAERLAAALRADEERA